MLKSIRIIVYVISGIACLYQKTTMANEFFDNLSPSPETKTRYGMGYESRMQRARLINESTDIEASHVITAGRPGKIEKSGRFEQTTRPSRPERPMRTARPYRPEHPVRPGR